MGHLVEDRILKRQTYNWDNKSGRRYQYKRQTYRWDKYGNDDAEGELGRSSRNQDNCGIIDDQVASGKSRVTNQEPR